ncbi:VOC family protein [Sciscionella sediminilitoris]|uniref:VOC family protein n=1 Tax=Sciscionella sediminilitoris TaxID=1445613 RepID=UPI00055A9020|nr:VOC family protein [Sciscionella sp. SE31]
MAENTAVISGIHHLKIPVSDLAVSRAWYEKVFDYRVRIEFPDADGTVRGVAGEIGGITVALRENPAAARGASGFDPICFAIPDRAAARAWAARLARLGVEHTPPGEGTQGWVVQVLDPDGIAIRLYSTATEDTTDRRGTPGYPRRAEQSHRNPDDR